MSRRSWLSFAWVAVALIPGGCSDDGQQTTADGAADFTPRPDRSTADLSPPDPDISPPAADQFVPDMTTEFPNKPGGNPLVPEVAAYPFPSDFYLVKDSSTKTGRRVSIPKDALPKQVPTTMVSEHDGFSRIPLILAFLPGGIDPTSLPPADDPAKSVAVDSPVLLVEQGTHTLVPLLAENDLTALTAAKRALIIRPLVALAPDTGYVVILRDKLRDPQGKAHAANAAFRALRDGIKSADPALEKQRDDFKAVTAAITALNLKPAEVVLAWSFHTRSEEQVLGPLQAMQAVAQNAPLSGYTIVSDTKDGYNNRQIEATFKAPNFIGPLDLRIKLDKSGAPIQQGQRTVTFGVTIPDSVNKPRPVLLFGHGFFGDWEQVKSGSFNTLCRDNGFSAVATNIGFHAGTQLLFLPAFTSDMGKLNIVVDEILQTYVNVTALARLTKEKLAGDLIKTTSAGTTEVFDASEVHYLGASNGATCGFVVAATSPQLTRAVLTVGGGGLIHFLQRAVQWNSYQFGVNLFFPDALERQLVMSLIQQVLDPIDAMNYAPRLLQNRLPGLKPLAVSMHMAVNDCQVSNLVTEWMARSAKVPLVTPSPKTIYGLQTITAAPPGGAPVGTKGALIVYDEGAFAPPTGNIPPPKDNGTHKHVRTLDSYMKHVAAFVEQGKLVQLCSGACDPM